jgi:Family of unknown function (DUF6152)
MGNLEMRPAFQPHRLPTRLIISHTRQIVLLLAAILTIVPSLSAHHGLARFDTTHIVSMQGTVSDFQWINPHAYVYADLTDEHGKVANWSLECGSLGMLSRFGWSPDVLKKGDHVTVHGFVAKDHSPYMSLQKIDLPNGKSLPGAP